MKIRTVTVAALLAALMMIGSGGNQAIAGPRGRSVVGAVAGFAIGAILLNEMMKAQATQAQAAQVQAARAQAARAQAVAQAQARAQVAAQARAQRRQVARTQSASQTGSTARAWNSVAPAPYNAPPKASRLCGMTSCQ
jgi:hypothetical protein